MLRFLTVLHFMAFCLFVMMVRLLVRAAFFVRQGLALRSFHPDEDGLFLWNDGSWRARRHRRRHDFPVTLLLLLLFQMVERIEVQLDAGLLVGALLLRLIGIVLRQSGNRRQYQGSGGKKTKGVFHIFPMAQWHGAK